MARDLGANASAVIRPGNILVVDESLYEFNGTCPVKRYIPRKPHPNGLLVYGLSGYLLAGADQIPYVLDYEPFTLNNQVSAQDAMMALHGRLRQRIPGLRPHLVVDSAFGSFEKLREIVAAGGGATMSMPANTKPWMWSLLDFNCGIDEGRMAMLPKEGIVINSFKVLSETGTEHQIKTISSHCGVEAVGDDDEIIIKIIDRRIKDGVIEYQGEFVNGKNDWFSAREFIDPDGTVVFSWLEYVSVEDLTEAFSTYTQAQLRVRAEVDNDIF